MKQGFLIGVGIVLLLSIGVFGYWSTQQDSNSTSSSNDNSTISPNLTGQTKGEQLGLKGALASNYYLFDLSNYELVKNSQTPYYLNFYANWCPTCAAQAKIDLPFFNNMPENPVVALRVNTLDSDTDANEEKLAEELGVRFQHTLIFFNSDGEETGRLFGTSNTDKLQEELNKAAGIL